MKLEIDLADRDEIAAAVPLLQLILNNTFMRSPCAGECVHSPKPGHPCEAEAVNGEPPCAENGGPILDPAAIFGGATAPLAPSAPALSTAGAVPSMTAPEVPPAISIPAPAPLPSVPSPAVPAPVQQAPAAPTTPATVVDLDSRGLPWDDRIHASTKAKVQDGSWKKKRGVGETYVLQVEAQLRGQPVMTPTVPPAPVITPQPWPFAATDAAAPEVPSTPAIPTAPQVVPSAPVAPAAPSEPVTFDQLMPRLTAAITSGVMPPTALQAACAAQGLASIVALQTQQQYVPLVWAALKAQFPALV